jgi:hypothetical protein
MSKQPNVRVEVKAAAKAFIKQHETTLYNLAARDVGQPLKPHKPARKGP